MKLDIILMVGGQSGFELALNRTADYLVSHSVSVRFIQIVTTGYDWPTKMADFVDLGFKSELNINDCINKYVALCLQGEVPDLIIATGMPETLYIAKTAAQSLSFPVPIAAWYQNDLSYYGITDEKGFEVFEYSDYVYATNDKMAGFIMQKYPQKPIYRVFNPINPDNIVFSYKRNTRKLAYIGRLTSEKNVSLIIKALAIASDYWHLTIIGNGPEKETLVQLAASLDLSDQITFISWTDTPWSLVSDCRALIVSSIDNFEGGPMTCIEALTCGMPVLSTPAGFVPEVIVPHKNGYLYDYDDEAGLANILDNISKENVTIEMSNNCRESVSNFLPENALWDFLCKVVASANLVGLPQRRWQNSEKRLVRYKTSVILSDSSASKDSSKEPQFLDQLKALANQTIEPQYLEIIIVHCADCTDLEPHIMAFEQAHPDNVMVINCDSAPTKEEAYGIAMPYASGDMSFYIDNKESLSNDTIEKWYLDKLCNP